MFNACDCVDNNYQNRTSQNNERLVMTNGVAMMFIRSIVDLFYKYGINSICQNTLHVDLEEDGSRAKKVFYEHKITIRFQSRSRSVFKELRPSAPTIIETRPRFKVTPVATLPTAQHIEAAFAEAAEAMNNFKKALAEAKNVLDLLTNETEK